MPRGPDPRSEPPPLADVPRLVARGAALFGAARYWDAHESWEEAWHALRAAGRAGEAAFLRGLILATAAWENLTRGKPDGFRRQGARALVELRANAGRGAALGVRGEAAFVEALTEAYLANAARTDLGPATGRAPPRLDVESPGDETLL